MSAFDDSITMALRQAILDLVVVLDGLSLDQDGEQGLDPLQSLVGGHGPPASRVGWG